MLWLRNRGRVLYKSKIYGMTVRDGRASTSAVRTSGHAAQSPAGRAQHRSFISPAVDAHTHIPTDYYFVY